MTAPLTPPDCDLQDFPFMPLHVARLRDSDFAAEESPEACWYAVLLWAVSWHQLPAGSLPDSDAVLAKLIGLGRDVKTFRKHKAGAMRGFVLCDDGRLYHPIVAEQVTAAWESKLQQRWRTECARIKKANQRNDTNHTSPTYEEFLAWTSQGQGDPGPNTVPRDVPGDNQVCPEGNHLQETGTGTGNIIDTPIAPKGADKLALPKVVLRQADVEEVWEITPARARQRTSKTDILKAMQGAARRGHSPAAVIAGLIAYYASAEATKDGGEYAKGAHRMITADRWQGFSEAATPLEAVADAPDPLDVWRRRVDRYLNGSRFWNTTDWGPEPGRSGCTVPAEILREFEISPSPVVVQKERAA